MRRDLRVTLEGSDEEQEAQLAAILDAEADQDHLREIAEDAAEYEHEGA